MPSGRPTTAAKSASTRPVPPFSTLREELAFLAGGDPILASMLRREVEGPRIADGTVLETRPLTVDRYIGLYRAGEDGFLEEGDDAPLSDEAGYSMRIVEILRALEEEAHGLPESPADRADPAAANG